MGIFLVFFPEEQQNFNSSTPSSTFSPFKSPKFNSILKRTNSNHIFTRTQSTISICALLIFLTLLLFTLSSFEPNNDFISSHRRFLTNHHHHHRTNFPANSPALQGLGTLYTRGTTAMNELIICHVTEFVTKKELKLFLRAFHGSGLPSKSDLLFIFNSGSTLDSFDELIYQENKIFLKLVHRNKAADFLPSPSSPASFDPTQFVKSGKEPDKGEPIWGKRVKSYNSSFNETELTRTSYGSVVGFGIGELDPENSLSGFLGPDPVPLGLRRWAAYPMVLGRVRKKFKHIILVDVKEILLLGDPLARVKTHSPESIFLTKSHRKTNKFGSKSHRKTINPALIIGGERGVRRLSAAVMTEIVRSTTRQHHNKRNTITESALLSQLSGNEYLQKSIRFGSTESIPEPPSSLSGVEIANLTVVVRTGNSNLDEVIMKHICSFSIDASVYTDC